MKIINANEEFDGKNWRIDVCDIKGSEEEYEGLCYVEGPDHVLKEFPFKFAQNDCLFGNINAPDEPENWYPEFVVDGIYEEVNEAVADYAKKIAAIDAGEWTVDVCDIRRVDERIGSQDVDGEEYEFCDYHHEGTLVFSGPDGISEASFYLEFYNDYPAGRIEFETSGDIPEELAPIIGSEIKNAVSAFDQKNQNTINLMRSNCSVTKDEMSLLSPYQLFVANAININKLALDFIRDPDFSVQITDDPENDLYVESVYMDLNGKLYTSNVEYGDVPPYGIPAVTVATVKPACPISLHDAADLIWDNLSSEGRWDQLVNWCRDYAHDKLGTFTEHDTVDAGKYGYGMFDDVCGVLDNVKDKDEIKSLLEDFTDENRNLIYTDVDVTPEGELLREYATITSCTQIPATPQQRQYWGNNSPDVYKPSEDSPIYELAREKEISR